ncbi:hypothetical protein FHX82_000573 [Amycolatopsis bartoniae]|nr:hypothetical protein [Amycolatopsis bartoniae]
MSVSTRWVVMPWAVKKLWARRQNATAVSFLSSGQDLGVGQPGMVVHGVVQVAVSDMAVAACVEGFAGCAGAMPLPCLPTGDAVPASVGDVAQLLDVHVDQFTGSGMFVAADRPAGDSVEMGQAG